MPFASSGGPLFEPGFGPGMPFRFNKGLGGGANVPGVGVAALVAGVGAFESAGLSESDGS
jgi:hypothetical protein